MTIRFPSPLKPGDTIAVTSPSSGVTDDLHARLEFAIATVRDRGYRVLVGEWMDGTSHTSGPATERARELTQFLTTPDVHAVIPPWGGETAIDLLPLMDWEAIRSAEPTWFVGFSDISTLITPLTLRTGVATVHGNNLMDTPYRVPSGLSNWLDIVALDPGNTFVQASPGRYRSSPSDSFIFTPDVTEMTLDASGGWTRMDAGTSPVDVQGRLIGGCIETLCNIAGTPYGDIPTFTQTYAPEGLIVYIEAAGDEAFSICRNLHGMKLAGFFDHANAVLVGRTNAPDSATMSQREAVLDALTSLDVPILGDVDCGHVQPFMPIVNGALGHVKFTDTEQSLTQTLA